jgi:hypothetical protein
MEVPTGPGHMLDFRQSLGTRAFFFFFLVWELVIEASDLFQLHSQSGGNCLFAHKKRLHRALLKGGGGMGLDSLFKQAKSH